MIMAIWGFISVTLLSVGMLLSLAEFTFTEIDGWGVGGGEFGVSCLVSSITFIHLADK